jgi:hypothetical protein
MPYDCEFFSSAMWSKERSYLYLEDAQRYCEETTREMMASDVKEQGVQPKPPVKKRFYEFWK